MLHKEITDKILRVFFDVYNELGSGFLESVYANALAIVFEDKGIVFGKEVSIEVRFRGEVVGVFRADFLIEEKVIIELKACKTIDNAHIAQTINYLRATGMEIGLILNFGPKPEFKRLANSQ